MRGSDVDALRAEFPALRREQGRPPGGLPRWTGRHAGPATRDRRGSRLSDRQQRQSRRRIRDQRGIRLPSSDDAHAAVADLLGAGSPDEIKFGYNMSTLTLHVGRSIGATLDPGDEIVVTTLDHEANVSTWEAMAADRGLTVRKVDIREDDVTLDLEDLESKLKRHGRSSSRSAMPATPSGRSTRSARSSARAHEVGALTYIDAVAYAPHGPIDVRALDTDFLVCSVYKWFGPHLGALYGKAEVFDSLPAFKVRPAHDRFETGTANFESIAGTLAATEYLRDIGRRFGDPGGSSRREELVAGLQAIVGYERALVTRLIEGLEHIPGLTIHGITDRARFDERVPTVSVSIDGVDPRAAAETLGRQGIFVWDGDFYATGLIERLGKAETGGVLRIGLVHYNTAEEVDRTLDVIASIASGVLRDDRGVDPGAYRAPVRRLGAAPHQTAVGPPFDRRGPARHRRADRHPSRPTASTRSWSPASAGRARLARVPSTPSSFAAFRTTRSRCQRSSSVPRACSRSRR
jgi:cysteine desulfurase family protein (TIGR01976 family)